METKQPEKYTYAILQETNDEEGESWLYFIRYQGNEEALKNLQKQFQLVDWELMDDLSAFEMEIDYLVSEQTAKEMTKVDLNSCGFHRKFDGKLQMIDFKLKPNSSTEKKMKKINKLIGYGKIDEYIDEEDIDPEDLQTEEESDDSTESESEDEKQEETKKPHRKKTGKLPAILIKKIKQEQKK